jgi:hypothetical protein
MSDEMRLTWNSPRLLSEPERAVNMRRPVATESPQFLTWTLLFVVKVGVLSAVSIQSDAMQCTGGLRGLARPSRLRLPLYLS